MLCPRKVINLALLLAATAAATILWVSPRVLADNAPDWLRAAAQDKLPDYPKDTVAVVLLDDVQTTIKDNGEIETRTRRAYKLLRPEARKDYDSAVARSANDTKITFFKAWTITPDGHEFEVKEKDAAEVGLTSFELYSDQRAKILRFPEPNPGSVVGYELVQKQRPYVLDDEWGFQDTIPVRKSRFSIQLPAGWEYTTFFENHAEIKPQSNGSNQSVWEIMDSPAIEVEPDMPAWNSVAGEMLVKYFPRDPAMRAKTSGSWREIGNWYNTLTTSSRNATPQIQQKVTDLTAGMTDPLAKMKALADYTQQKIRYAAIEIGIGGHQPHPAGQVFAHQYGDCKDKATLLGSMLHEIGIESYYVLINTQRGTTAPGFPSVRFNHAIIAIRLPDSIPDTTLYAVVKHPKLGRILFFDPTDEYVPIGYLPWEEQDNYGLMVTPDGGELMSLPLLPPSTNRLLRTAKFNLSAAGDLSGEIQEVRWGGPAESSRAQYLEIPPAQRSKVLDEFVGNFLNNFTVTNATLENLEKFDDTLTIDYKFTAQSYAKSAGSLLIVRPRVVGSKETNLLSLLSAKKPRQYAIEFNEATRQDDVFDINLPPGYVVDELPKPVDAECEYASYKSDVQVTGNTLHYKRTYVVKDVMVPTMKVNDVRDFFRQVAADERTSAVLKRATP
jgi:Domain of Unknown Function with PDB structure (DUF3857)/Transglutaminase-like superfamily